MAQGDAAKTEKKDAEKSAKDIEKKKKEEKKKEEEMVIGSIRCSIPYTRSVTDNPFYVRVLKILSSRKSWVY